LQEEWGGRSLPVLAAKAWSRLSLGLLLSCPAPAPSLFFYLFFSLASVLFFFPTFSVPFFSLFFLFIVFCVCVLGFLFFRLDSKLLSHISGLRFLGFWLVFFLLFSQLFLLFFLPLRSPLFFPFISTRAWNLILISPGL